MAEQEIKRVNFFDGQFLKELEFQEEQYYHMHMRRRLYYFLFERSGVISGNDELDFININSVNKTFQVKPGMAIGRNNAEMEAREITLKNEVTIDLTTAGIPDPGTAYVTIHYDEQGAKEPPSEADVDKDTRIKEKAVIDVYPSLADIPAATPKGDEYIILGALDYPSMTKKADFDTIRQEARIRTTLTGAVPGEETPTIDSIKPQSGVRGTIVDAEISGKNLDGATDVTFSGSDVKAYIQPVTTPGIIPIQINIDSYADPGQRTFTVMLPSGPVSSAGIAAAAFEVIKATPVPIIESFSPMKQKSTYTITIVGTNIRSKDLVPPFPKPAPETTVKFVHQTDPGKFVVGENPTALLDIGGSQRVMVTVPEPTPTFANNARVKLILEIGGESAEAPNLFEFKP